MQFLNHGKNNLSDVKENMHNLVIQDHHLIRKHHMCFLNRLSSKEIYNFLIYLQKKKLHPSRDICSHLAHFLRPSSKNKNEIPSRKVLIFSYILGNGTFWL